MNPKPTSVLIVDDDPVFSLFVRQLVTSLGGELPCRVATTDCAEAGLKEIRDGCFELLLLDYHLPRGTGLDLLADIQKLPLERQPAVVMLTGSGNEAVAVEAMKRGAKDYLQKNEVDLPSLMRAMKNALSQKRLAEQVEAYHAQINADLEMARKLQESLLPQSYPTFPQDCPVEKSALRFQHRYFWAAQLGGDFFNVQHLSDTRAGVLICDVMGHGVRSALITAMLRAMTGDLEAHADDPSRFLSEMNRKLAAILRQIEESIYATAFYMVADLAEGRLRYAKAGHPPPVHVQRHAGKVSPLPIPQRAGAALGLFADTEYVMGECPLAVDDALLLFTDGLFEVPNEDDEDYGQERLLVAAEERMKLPLPAMMDGLIADVRNYSGGADFNDDVCLLGMEIARLGSLELK